MGGYLITSGNDIVDEVGGINVTGNVIPHIWYRNITRENGKPYLLAIILLADIRYWYCPTEVRDEANGHIVGWKKKFKGDLLQKTYQQYADFLGESKDAVKRAMDALERLEVIKRHFREVELPGGTKLSNVMYIELLPQRLKELTYPKKEDIQGSDAVPIPSPGISGDPPRKFQGILPGNFGTPSPKILGDPPQKFQDTLPGNFATPSSEILGDSPRKFDGYTKNTTEITQENTSESTYREYNIHPVNQVSCGMKGSVGQTDQIHAYRESIKEHIELDILLRNKDMGQEEVLEIYEVICDMVCFPRENVIMNGASYPWEVVKDQFLKLNYEHICYVLERMKTTTTKINNIRAYLITALYNSLQSIDTYYQQEAMHDMYGFHE